MVATSACNLLLNVRRGRWRSRRPGTIIPTWKKKLTFAGFIAPPGFAFVTDNTMTFDIPEAEYRECGYTPEYDSLPSKDAYKASPTSKGANR